MSVIEVKELSHPAGEVLKIAAGKTLDLHSQGSVTMPAGSVIQTQVRTIAPVIISTGGTWSASNTITAPNTYTVENFAFTKKYANSIVVGSCLGHVDSGGSVDGGPTVVALTGGSGNNGNGNLVLGAAYKHVRVANTEPFSVAFYFEDTRSGVLEQTYSLRCHSSNTIMAFSRFTAVSSGQNPFRITLMEIAQ